MSGRLLKRGQEVSGLLSLRIAGQNHNKPRVASGFDYMAVMHIWRTLGTSERLPVRLDDLPPAEDGEVLANVRRSAPVDL